MKNIDTNTGYHATYKGVKGILVYFFVYVDAWCFAPWDRRDDAREYGVVNVEEVKIGGKI